MARVMAFDAGIKRVGIAVTDPLQIIAQALDTVEAAQLISYVKKYIGTETVECFVVGEPKNLDGTVTDGTPVADKLVADLGHHFPAIPVVRVDERFTSSMALQSMIDNGIRQKQRRDKAELDKVSAALILQSYLERRTR